jgi:hypothetical protein
MIMALRVAHGFAATPARGAQIITYLASSPAISGVTGKYFDQERATASSPQSYEAVAALLEVRPIAGADPDEGRDQTHINRPGADLARHILYLCVRRGG